MKHLTFRFKDNKKYFDFTDKIRRDGLSFQAFVEQAIEDYMNDNYNPTEKHSKK